MPLPRLSPVRSIAAMLAATTLPLTAAAQALVPEGDENRPEIAPAFPEQTEAPAQSSPFVGAPDAVATGLDTPWGIAVLPGAAGYLVTERPGTLRHVGRDGTISAPISGVPDVFDLAQGGLLDIALAPDFSRTRRVYISYSKPVGLAQSATAVIRARLSEDARALEDVTEIFEQTPPSLYPMHFGSRVEADEAGTIWITTGERGATRNVQMRAQDVTTAYGGVFRVTVDGAPAPGNPFASRGDAAPLRVTLGQRNPQGLARDPATSAVWTVEHGPAGGDEVNMIEPGANYGWPLVSYGVNYNGSEVGDGRAAHAPDFVEPVYYWDPVIAPGGMAIYPEGAAMFPEFAGDLLIGGLQAEAVVRLDIDGTTVVGEERLAEGIGRVRDVAIDHDGAILFLIDSDDGGLYRLARGE